MSSQHDETIGLILSRVEQLERTIAQLGRQIDAAFSAVADQLHVGADPPAKPKIGSVWLKTGDGETIALVWKGEGWS